jgi:hypothetical protein
MTSGGPGRAARLRTRLHPARQNAPAAGRLGRAGKLVQGGTECPASVTVVAGRAQGGGTVW